MKLIRSAFYPFVILIALASLQACKAKKIVEKPYTPTVTYPSDPVATETQKPAAATPTTPAPAPVAAPVQQANYNFGNIQFEFNSGVLKTESYSLLDEAASAMKANPSIKFNLNGYASAEGTADHNMDLSVNRANAVKVYLMNSGVSGSNLIAKGFGEANPIADNTTEAGKVINRRVEIKMQN